MAHDIDTKDPRVIAVAEALAWNARPGGTDETGWNPHRFFAELVSEWNRGTYLMQGRVAVETLIEVGAIPDFLAAAE